MSDYRKNSNYFFLIADLISLSLSFILAIYITKKRLIIMPEISFKVEALEIILLVLFLLVWGVFSNWTGLYDSFKTAGIFSGFLILLKSVLVQLLISVVLLFFLKNILFSRFFLFVYIFLLIASLIVNRIIINTSLKIFKGSGKFSRKIVIIGDNRSCNELYKMINGRFDSYYKILGTISEKKPVEDYKVYLGNMQKLEDILDKNEVDDVIISLEQSEYNTLDSILSRCESYPVRVKIIPEYSRFLSKKFQIETFGSIPIISIEDDPLDNIHWRVIKRFIDVLISTSVFVFLFIWIYPLIAFAIKFTSNGPVFFKQERWGRKNKKITVYKFRTMRVDSLDIDKDGTYNQAIKNDPRITSAGSFLRKTNLDELPQILNVMMGNMSIIGPRPHPTPLNIESKGSIKKYLKRHLVKPGITGWAQVNGLRGETKKEGLMQKRVAHDIWYIENWSLWLDFQIILLTIWNMIKGDRNAY